MEIKKIDRDNRERINDFIIRQWFSLQMVVHGESIDLGKAEGWYACEDHEIIGLVTYRITRNDNLQGNGLSPAFRPDRRESGGVIKRLSDSSLHTPCIRYIPFRFHVSSNYQSHPHSSGKHACISRRRCIFPCHISNESEKNNSSVS